MAMKAALLAVSISKQLLPTFEVIRVRWDRRSQAAFRIGNDDLFGDIDRLDIDVGLFLDLYLLDLLGRRRRLDSHNTDAACSWCMAGPRRCRR